MTKVAWRMLAHKPVRLFAAWIGLGVLFFLAAAQIGLLVGWCNTCSAIVRHAEADIWVMAQQTSAFDYGTSIPQQRVYQARSIKGVARAEAMIMAWNTWQRPDGRRVNIELVGLDRGCFGGPWAMQEGNVEVVHQPDGVIVDDLFLDALGVQGVGDEAEMYDHRAVVRGISNEIRTLTASPFVFTSIESARRFDKRYGPNDITYVLVECSSGYVPEDVQAVLRAELPHVEVLTRREFAIRTMKYWMLETGLGITVVLTAILGLTVSVVVTSQTLFTVTQEYLRNYATLTAVGFGWDQLLGCVVMQGLFLICGGISIGSVLFATASYLSSRTPIPLEMLPEVYVGLVGVSLLSSLGGVFLSIRAVLRVDPASVFRG